MYRFIRNPDPREKPPYGSILDPHHPLSDGLVGCWLMNEGGGNKIFDLSGKNHGVNDASWIPNGLDFNGSNKVDCGNNPSIQLQNDLTIFAIVRRSTVDATYRPIICKYNTSNDQRSWWLGVYSGNYMDFLSPGGEWGTNYVTMPDGTNGAKASICYAKSASSVYLYFDGILKDSNASAPLTLHNSTENAKIGLYNGGGWNDEIHNVFLYNRALSPGEIVQLYAEPYAHILMPQYWFMADFGAVTAGGLSIPNPLHRPLAGPLGGPL